VAYTSIRTAHSVGDTVYYHDSESDSVRRCVVESIEARSAENGYSPKWTVMYRVAHKHASDPGPVALICEDDLKETPREAFPEIVMHAEQVPA